MAQPYQIDQARYSFTNTSAEVVRLSCENCGPAGQYRKQKLIERYGADIRLPDMRWEISQCRRHGQMHATKADTVEKDFPHFVDMVVPPGGLGSKLDAMYEFHTQYGIRPQRGHGRHDANGAVIRSCFAEAELANNFAREFSVS
jgi:hypothetical protein